MSILRRLGLLAVVTAAMVSSPVHGKPDRRRKHKIRMAAPAAMSATPGGAQDIGHFRDRVKAGGVPHPKTFTPEGLLSEHDLPLRGAPACAKLLCAHGEAMEASLIVQPDVDYLGQLGFATNIEATTFKRKPLNLVAVVDKSGSMSGQPLALVRKSLTETLKHLGRGDQLSIVLYGDRAHVHLAPTGVGTGRAKIARAIDSIVSAGSTAMEDGLRQGFNVAVRSKRDFKGITRVMLFTDERPNVGRTDPASFMSMAHDASRRGVGMTTVGVGVQFGAELATKVSSVRGGNLYFFPDAAKMSKVFEQEFDTMVTELAHNLRLRIAPAPGMKIAGVYGIPGDRLKWSGTSLELEIATVFLSRKHGAIYVAVAPAGTSSLPPSKVAVGDPIASVDLSYRTLAGKRESGRTKLRRVDRKRVSTGLTRGRLLVDQVTAMKEATRRHHEANDQEGAYQLVHALAGRYRHVADPTLRAERKLVLRLEQTLAKLSGHQGETTLPIATKDLVTGLPPH